MNGWIAIDDRLPKQGEAVVWGGPSGYRPPHDWAELSGYYDPVYRPKNPVLSWNGDAVSDFFNATHWRPATPKPVDMCEEHNLTPGETCGICGATAAIVGGGITRV